MAANRMGCWLLALVCLPCVVQAGKFRVRISDSAGAPVADAVISLNPVDTPAPSVKATAVMDQRGLRFVPFVLPIQVGTSVAFPNSDNLRHHVYSFSPAKRFELRLYAGNHASAVQFDQPGVVTLGCNIHDWMVGYVYVLDTPYFAKTGADGAAEVANLPAGAYVVRLWHPRIDGSVALMVDGHTTIGSTPLQRDYRLKLHPVDQSNVPPTDLEIGLGQRMHGHGN